MKLLIAGDIVGSPGRRIFKQAVSYLRDKRLVNAVVVNGENAAAGSGITEALAKELLDAGADLITLGDHVWNQKETATLLARDRRLIRPANMTPHCPGHGWATFQTAFGPITVVSLLGRVFMPPIDCPFAAIDALLPTIPAGAPIIVDFHAEATSEKIAMGWHLDGRVAAVIGSHTHVQTNDAKLLPAGTAYLTDLGMTGPVNSVIGRDVKPVLHKFITGMPARFEVAKGPAVLEGAIVEIDRTSARARSITPIRLRDDGTNLLEWVP